MTTNTLPGSAASLAGFLRECRERARPPTTTGRRRTPGLRREEVATRAGVSLTWYTWLEQGRGGPPSVEALDRIAAALDLDGAAREVLFLLAQGRPPPLRPTEPPPVSDAAQRVLDAMPRSPAIVKTPSWDIVAWNEAASAVFGDYAAVPATERNILRRLFDPSFERSGLQNWEANARFILAVFRTDVARSGGCPSAATLAAELSDTSADFRRLWAETEPATHGVGRKRIDRPPYGTLTLEYSAYAIDGLDGLSMLVFIPPTRDDQGIVDHLIDDRRRAGAGEMPRAA